MKKDKIIQQRNVCEMDVAYSVEIFESLQSQLINQGGKIKMLCFPDVLSVMINSLQTKFILMIIVIVI